MKEIILKELENWKDLQPNMASEVLRESLANKIAEVLSENGFSKKSS